MARPKGKALARVSKAKAKSENVAEIIREIPEDLPVLYSNHFVVQYEAAVFNLLFFHIQPPMVLGDSAKQLAAVKKIKSVKAKCVARVVIPADKMEGVIHALAENWQRRVDLANSQTPTE